MRRPPQIALTLAGCTLLIGSIYAISARVINEGFQRVEETSVSDNMKRMRHALINQIAQLDSVAAPWSQWTEACGFANAPLPSSTDFARDELSDGALASVTANSILYSRRDGRIVFSTGYDIKTSKSRPLPHGLSELLQREPALLRHQDSLIHRNGIVMLPEGPMIVTSQPLLQSAAKGKVYGAFLAGRFFDEEISRQMSQRVGNSVELRDLKAPLPPDFAAARAELEKKSSPELIRALSESTIAGYTLINDWKQNPVLIARVSAPRLIHAQARQSIAALFWSVSGIGATGTLLLLVAQARLTRAERERQEEQTRFRSVFEGLGEGVLITDLQDVVINANARLQEMSGYKVDEMVGRPAYELLLPRAEWPVLQSRNLKREKGQSEVYEARMQRRDASEFWAMVHATPLRDTSGAIVGTIGALIDITARVEAERKLHESEQRLRTIVTNAPIVLFALDKEGVFTLSEGRGLEQFGWKPGEVVGRSAFEVYALFPAIVAGLQRALAGQEVSNTSEAVGKIWDGRYTSVWDSSGQVSGVIGVATDVTERVEAQTQLRESEMRFRSVVETATDAIVLADGNGTILSCNHGAQRVFGYRENEMIGAPFGLLMPQSCPIGFEEGKDVTKNPLAGRAIELMAQRKSGEEFPVELMLDVWRLGEKTFHSSILRDISARKEMENQLRSALEERRLIMEAIPDVIFRLDLNGNLVAWNRVLEEATGFGRAELLGRNAIAFFAPDDGPRVLATIQASIETGFAAVEAPLLRQNREALPMAWTAVPLHDENGRIMGLTGTGRDITERQKAELTLRAALHEKEVLLKEIHHRVKNNLQIISSLLSWQSDILSDAPAREALSESRQRVHSMALIHERLYQAGDLAHLDFREYLSNLCHSLMGSYAGKGAQATLDLQIDCIHLNVDLAVPCGLIVNELVSNALKYAFPDGQKGTITVTFCSLENGQLALGVADDGIGLPPNFNIESSDSIGTQLVTGLCTQLEGSYALDGTHGTRWTIYFKNLS